MPKCTVVKTETKLCSTRRTDVYGFDANKNKHYVCEVKVRWTDAQKAPMQLTAPANHLLKKYRNTTVVPVLAIPVDLQRELKKNWPGNWKELTDLCRLNAISIWAIEWKGIRQILGSKGLTAKPKEGKVATVKVTRPELKQVKAKTTKAKSTKTAKASAKTSKTAKATSVKSKKTKTKSTKGRATKSSTKSAKATKSKK